MTTCGQEPAMLHHLRPHYAKNFRCIGSDCEDTCCQGWEVVIDQNAYQQLHSLDRMPAEMKQHLVVIENPTTAEYARIQLTPACTCPFLSADRLCNIQVDHGERYLPDICASYPRAVNKIDGLRETSLLLACPEAARLVLLNAELVQPETPGLPRYHPFTRMADEVRANGSPHQFLWEIREFALLLLRDREYRLWQRIFLLGMFCKRLHEITEAQQVGLIPKLLKEHVKLIVDGRLRSTMDDIPVRTPMQLATVLRMIKHHLETTAGRHPRFRECVRDFLRGIHCEEGAPIENCSSSFEENNAQYYNPFLEKHPHLLENFLLNYVFRARFPYGADPRGKINDPLSQFFMMCILYTLIKELLIGISGLYREGFNATHVVKVVQSVAKSVEQCPKFPLANYMSLADADGMALLLKNSC